MPVAGEAASISPAAPFVLAAGVALASAAGTSLALRYARRRLLDLPGRRRSHEAPTPRGGGIGIVLALAPVLALATGFLPASARAAGVAVLVGLALVAAIGWVDDHRPLRALPRLLVHLAASVLLAWGLLAPAASSSPAFLAILGGWIVLTTAWSINLHNFMDGIDGILAGQALFVFGSFAASTAASDPVFATGSLACTAAVAGFLPFNAPRARIFMGDVGSGALGFLIAAMAWIGILGGALRTSTVLLACSAFLVDATCTLLSRMLGGRRWYSAHREHLYQWLVRCGHAHARVTALYLVWNLLVVLPLILWLQRSPAPSARAATVAVALVYALAVAGWVFGKRRCLSARRPARRGDAAA